MNSGLSITEHELLQLELRQLPETMPPRSVWERVDAQARAEGLIRRPGVSQRTRWFAGAGIAAAVVLAVLTVPGQSVTDLPSPVGTDASLSTVPDFQENAADVQLRSINALMVQSQVLERDLRRLPASPQLMQASTAATIEDLQSRIAAIDYQLNHPDVQMTRQEQEVYWRERVRLMDSLVLLRFAQTRRGSF